MLLRRLMFDAYDGFTKYLYIVFFIFIFIFILNIFLFSILFHNYIIENNIFCFFKFFNKIKNKIKSFIFVILYFFIRLFSILKNSIKSPTFSFIITYFIFYSQSSSRKKMSKRNVQCKVTQYGKTTNTSPLEYHYI